MRFTRDFYKPSQWSARVVGKKVPYEIYLYEMAGAPYACGFGGKRSKPDFHYRFRSEEARAEHVDEYIRNAEAHAKIRAEEKAKRTAFEHTLKVGDILYSSWGYDQTNIDFYQVTAVVGKKSVKIRRIGSRTDHSERGADYVVAAKDAFIESEDEMLKRVGQGNVITIESYANAYPWSGEPKYETASGWGH